MQQLAVQLAVPLAVPMAVPLAVPLAVQMCRCADGCELGDGTSLRSSRWRPGIRPLRSWRCSAATNLLEEHDEA